MLPLAVGQCSLQFTLIQGLVGGLTGSMGFIINLLVVKALYTGWQKYQEYTNNQHDKHQTVSGSAGSLPR